MLESNSTLPSKASAVEVGCREDDIENETYSDIQGGNAGYVIDQKNGGKPLRRGRAVAPMPCFTNIAKDKDSSFLPGSEICCITPGDLPTSRTTSVPTRKESMIPPMFAWRDYTRPTQSLKNFQQFLWEKVRRGISVL
jgi:hypothetical protein